MAEPAHRPRRPVVEPVVEHRSSSRAGRGGHDRGRGRAVAGRPVVESPSRPKPPSRRAGRARRGQAGRSFLSLPRRQPTEPKPASRCIRGRRGRTRARAARHRRAGGCRRARHRARHRARRGRAVAERPSCHCPSASPGAGAGGCVRGPRSRPEPEPLDIVEPAAAAEPDIEPVVEPVDEPSRSRRRRRTPPRPPRPPSPPSPPRTEPARRSFLSAAQAPAQGAEGSVSPAARTDRARATRRATWSRRQGPRTGQELSTAAVTGRASLRSSRPPRGRRPPVEPQSPSRPRRSPRSSRRKVSKHDEVATEMPGVYKFAAKRTSRRLLTISLLIGIVASAYFVRAAVEVKDTPSIGLAAIVVLATVMVWAIRGGASVTTLEVHQGQLQVIQQGGRFIFDLSSQYTRFEVHGQPGHRGWKVLFPRRGMAPFTVDASMVDPDDFMRVLRFFRPQLVHPLSPGVDPVAALAVAGVLVDPAVALDGARRGDVVVVTGQQHPIEPELGAAAYGEREGPRGVALRAPRGPHRVPDVTALLEQPCGQRVSQRQEPDDLLVGSGAVGDPVVGRSAHGPRAARWPGRRTRSTMATNSAQPASVTSSGPPSPCQAPEPWMVSEPNSVIVAAQLRCRRTSGRASAVMGHFTNSDRGTANGFRRSKTGTCSRVRVVDYRMDELSREEVEAERDLYGPFTESLRGLVDAAIRTTVPDGRDPPRPRRDRGDHRAAAQPRRCGRRTASTCAPTAAAGPGATPWWACATRSRPR